MNDCVDTTNAVEAYVDLAQNLLQATMEMYEPDDEPIEGNNIIIDIEGNESNEVQPNCLDDWRVIDVDYYLDEDRIRHVLEGGEYAIATPIIYYYHSDHLGGASWITDNNGEPIQYIHYMPYGELWRNQRNTTYDERYKFTGKERDAETGIISNCGEFAIIKMRVVYLLPNTNILQSISVAQPISHKEITILTKAIPFDKKSEPHQLRCGSNNIII